MRESPETLIVPYVDRDYQLADLEICDSCSWACAFLAASGGIAACPQCGNRVSHIPVTSDETYRITFDEKKGMVLEFGRRSLASSHD